VLYFKWMDITLLVSFYDSSTDLGKFDRKGACAFYSSGKVVCEYASINKKSIKSDFPLERLGESLDTDYEYRVSVSLRNW